MAGAADEAALVKETRRFGGSALVYLIPNLLVRGASVFLMPLYTRAMDPADFAIVAVANSLTAVLAIALGLSLNGCIPRLFFEFEERQKRLFFGTLLAVTLTVPTVVVGVLWALGSAGYLEVFETLHFQPHLKLVLLTSLFGIYLPLPQSVYMAREQPRRAAALGMAAGLSQLGLTLLFVAGLHEGAIGVLRANLISSAIVGLISLVLMARMSTISRSLPGLRTALAYSLPLVPHLAANWALAISDRLVLDRYVPAADVGRYSLGYMFSLIVSLIAASLGNAFSPMAARQLKDVALTSNVPPLGTYLVALTVGFGLAVAATAREVIAIIAPSAYAGAAPVVPWVVLGAIFQGLYFVWTTGTWFSMKTKLVPVVTGLSAAVNVGLNIIFVPRYGVMAAAVSTAVSYGLSAGLHGLLAEHLHPIPWEYRRWALVSFVGAACYMLTAVIPPLHIVAALGLKILIVVLGFPLGLLAVRFFTVAEIAQVRGLLARTGLLQ